MIDFACRCGRRFSVAEQEAGDDLQCPGCGLLNTIPTHSELPDLADDGTYHVDDQRRPEDEAAVREMGYVFKTGTRDTHGYEIDLRNKPKELAHVGEVDEPFLPEGNLVPTRPRYDPETGELILPIDVKPSSREYIDPATIPMATPALTYATVQPSTASMASTYLALMKPINLTVMLIMFAVQVSVQILIWILLYVGMWFAAPMLMGIQIALFCHYGNVIDEIGPSEGNELPRPMRDLRFHEDVWIPFAAMVGSATFCYLPALICLVAALCSPDVFWDVVIVLGLVVGAVVFWRIFWMLMMTDWEHVIWSVEVGLPIIASVVGFALVIGPAATMVMVAAEPITALTATAFLGLVGTFFVPAVMLTISTSGSSANLRPDRILCVIRIIGFRYIGPMIAWSIGAPAYLIGLTLISGGTLSLGNKSVSGWAGIGIISIDAAILAIAIYSMHVLSWQLGKFYRNYSEDFPWIFQMHQSTRKMRSASTIQRDIDARRAQRLQRPAVRRSTGPR